MDCFGRKKNIYYKIINLILGGESSTGVKLRLNEIKIYLNKTGGLYGHTSDSVS